MAGCGKSSFNRYAGACLRIVRIHQGNLSHVGGFLVVHQDFLKSEKGKSAQSEDFFSAVRIIGAKGLDPKICELHCLQRSCYLEFYNAVLVRVQSDVDTPESRLVTEFLLRHMRAVGFKEWEVVVCTLLCFPEINTESNRSSFLRGDGSDWATSLTTVVTRYLHNERFRGDLRLWEAYSMTIQSRDNYLEFEDFLLTLEQDLASTHEITEDALDKEGNESHITDNHIF